MASSKEQNARPYPTNLVRFRSDSALLLELWSRSGVGAGSGGGQEGEGRSPGIIARRDLDRFYYLLRRLLPKFPAAEAAVIVAAFKDEQDEIRPDYIHLAWAVVSDAIRSGSLDKVYGIDGDSLVERLRSLHRCELLATVDAAERAKVLLTRGLAATPVEAAQQVGLIAQPLSQEGMAVPESGAARQGS